jgi:hypothetical protein
MIGEAIKKRIKRNVAGFAPESKHILAKIAFVPKHAAERATRNTPINRSISNLSF